MNSQDLPPGHRVFKFGSIEDGVRTLWLGEPGDVVLQRGARIGQRLWLVVHVDQAVVWSHVVMKQVEVAEFTNAVYEGGHQWYLGKDQFNG